MRSAALCFKSLCMSLVAAWLTHFSAAIALTTADERLMAKVAGHCSVLASSKKTREGE